ncbi:hypothetical protein H2198_008674 [Neophaeococcomyces mojaviensis]|uniref:Uncharacterized protein n=1 Tax=Neophaeococcomyces mojaviensis TaxID=3383035 RepID=A0ACC2ZWS6_9EURO|nr:hypothetical protein H2198_008674 [Knufia sp. JES_112]
MQFHMEANPGSKDGILSVFELDLNFSTITPQPAKSIPRSLAGDQREMEASAAEVCLIGAPAPRCVAHAARTWMFWSSRLSDGDTGEAMAARWIWESNTDHELKGRVLHGGVALYHPGEPFRVNCHVKGKVLKPGGIILKFSNQHHQPRSWILVPKQCDENLQEYIEQLQANMERLNFLLSSSNQPLELIPTPNPISSPAIPSAYGSSAISGQAFVHMGDNYYGHSHNPGMA